MSGPSDRAALEQARGALSRALRSLRPEPVAWAGPGGEAHAQRCQGTPESLARLSAWAIDELDLLHMSLGWLSAQPRRPWPPRLIVVVEDLPPGLLQGLEAAQARGEELLVVLLDARRAYAPHSRTAFGRTRGSLVAYAEARGLQVLPQVELEHQERTLRALEEGQEQAGVRLLHLAGPGQTRPPLSSSRSSEEWLPPDPLAWPSAEPPDPPEGPEDLQAQILERMAEDLRERPQVEVLWTLAEATDAWKRLGDRFHPAPVQGCLLRAAGAATAGRHPLIVISSTRLPEIVGDLLSLAPFPATLVVLGGGLNLVEEDAPTHPAALRDLDLLRANGSLTLAVPSGEEEARGCFEALLELPGPSALRLSAIPTLALPTRGRAPALRPGTGRRLRPGGQLSLACMGATVLPTLLASEALHAWGVEAGVYDFRYLRPLDQGLLQEAAAAGAILSVEEHAVEGGLGTALLEGLSDLGGDPVRLRRLGIREGVPDSSPDAHGLSAEGIGAAARALLGLGR